MKYEDAVEIEALAADVFANREKVKSMQITNTPVDLEQRRQAFVALAMAESELSAAEGRLLQARGQMFAYGRLRNREKPR